MRVVADPVRINVLAPFNVIITGPTQTYPGISVTMVISHDGVPPADITLDWGDGTVIVTVFPGTTYNFSHTYNNAGSYPITANITDMPQNTGMGAHQITVLSPVTANLTVNNANPAINEEVTFTLTMGGGSPNYSWSLNPGDGVASYTGSDYPAGSVTQTHSYDRSGGFDAVLTVTDSLGEATQMGLRMGVGLDTLEAALLLVPAAVATGLFVVSRIL